MKRADLLLEVGPLCCLEIKMGVAEQPAVLQEFFNILGHSKGLQSLSAHCGQHCQNKNFSVTKPTKHSQPQKFNIYLLHSLLNLLCGGGNKTVILQITPD